jgi:hypothetical protein
MYQNFSSAEPTSLRQRLTGLSGLCAQNFAFVTVCWLQRATDSGNSSGKEIIHSTPLLHICTPSYSQLQVQQRKRFHACNLLNYLHLYQCGADLTADVQHPLPSTSFFSRIRVVHFLPAGNKKKLLRFIF